MKNIRVALLACMVALFAMSCEKDAEENDSPAFSGNRFKVEIASFRDANNSKAYLNWTESLSRIIYESGDKVQINGKSFTLSYEDGEWYANADNGQPYTGKVLYTAYCDGTLNAWDSNASGGPKYNFTINDYLENNTHNKLLLCGTSNSGSVITLQPACAILRVYTGNSGSSWTNVRVGFQSNKIPASGYIKPATGVITPTAYLEGVSQGSGGSINGDFLAMRWSKQSSAEGNHASSEQGYWYVAIPISGEEVSTTLYLGWNNGSTDVQHKTQGQVTLRKGYVYTLGTERQSPFNADGTSKCFFKVKSGMGGYVSFSPGNLQAKADLTGGLHTEWQFAPNQYDYIGSANTSNILDAGYFYDLFGFGTSDWNSGISGISSYNSWSASDFETTYIQQNLVGSYANADWGVYNGSNIKYGTTASGTTWRTLTSDEWNYLLNTRSNKGALATVNGTPGIVLLPDKNASSQTWVFEDEVGAGLTFTAGYTSYSTNVYSLSDWDKLETAGVIFLPAAGYRFGTDDAPQYGYPSTGYYWSSTYSATQLANALKFTSSGVTIAATGNTICNGYSVRLVHQQW